MFCEVGRQNPIPLIDIVNLVMKDAQKILSPTGDVRTPGRSYV